MIWEKIGLTLPLLSSRWAEIAGAVIFLAIGWLVALQLEKIVAAVLGRLRLEPTLRRIGWEGFLLQIHPGLTIWLGISVIIRSFVVLGVALTASEWMAFTMLSRFLEKIILYFPNIFISVLILIATAYVVDFAQKIVVGHTTPTGIRYSKFLGRSIDWAIRILATLAILYQLKILPQLILIVFGGVVLMTALGLGIAFGLAMQGPMARLLRDLKKRLN